MKRIMTAFVLGAAAAAALAPLVACEDDTTVNTAFKDAGAGEGGEAGDGGGGGKSEAGAANEGGSGGERGAAEAGASDASDDGG